MIAVRNVGLAVVLGLFAFAFTGVTRQNAEASASCVPMTVDQWNAWKDLIEFRPRQELLDAAKDTNWMWQSINDGVGDVVNLDRYEVEIGKMPTFGRRQLTGPELLEVVRTNLPFFVPLAQARFTGVDPESDGWKRGTPGAQMEFGIRLLDSDRAVADLAVHSAHVLLVDRSDTSWRFVTGHKESWLHPVNGVREFGIVTTNDGRTILFTRGADRISSHPRILLGNLIFSGGDALWQSFQAQIAAFINTRGGEARVLPPYSERHCWHDVQQYRRSLTTGPAAPNGLRIMR